MEEDVSVSLPPCAHKRIGNEAKIAARVTVGDLQKMVTFWLHEISKSTIRRHLRANKLFGWCARRKSFFHLTTNLSSLDANGTLTGTGFCGQMRQILGNAQGGFWCKKIRIFFPPGRT